MTSEVLIANRVREIRTKLRMRQEDLAAAVGVSRQTIIALERGRLNNPSIQTCLMLARALREPVDFLFYAIPVRRAPEAELNEEASDPEPWSNRAEPEPQSEDDAATDQAPAAEGVSEPIEPEYALETGPQALPIDASEPEAVPTPSEASLSEREADAPTADCRPVEEGPTQAVWDF